MINETSDTCVGSNPIAKDNSLRGKISAEVNKVENSFHKDMEEQRRYNERYMLDRKIDAVIQVFCSEIESLQSIVKQAIKKGK